VAHQEDDDTDEVGEMSSKKESKEEESGIAAIRVGKLRLSQMKIKMN
jgi:hypothetical protein